GKPYLDKPPLLYWLTAAAFKALGPTPQAARIVPALAALLTVLFTYLLGMRLVGPRGAWLGAMCLVTSIGFLICGSFISMYPLLPLFPTVSLLAGYYASCGPSLRPGWWAVAAAACGLGVLTKGPVALALVVPPLLCARWLDRAGAPLGFKPWAAYAAI